MFYIGRCAKAINLPRMYAVHTTVLIFYFYFIYFCLAKYLYLYGIFWKGTTPVLYRKKYSGKTELNDLRIIV